MEVPKDVLEASSDTSTAEKKVKKTAKRGRPKKKR